MGRARRLDGSIVPTKQEAWKLREHQSNLALLEELDEHTYRLVAEFTQEMCNLLLDFKPAPKEA
jgi:hypothetical protein